LPKLTYTTPPLSLLRELREVAADASALAIELAKANRLPADFPAEQLLELLGALQMLPGGTAEGCRQPLEYARARLPAIRRQFIQTEEQSLQPRVDPDAPPPLTRGMTIDLRLGALVNSVTTALDEYRALASVEDEDATDTSPSLEIDATASDAVNAMAAARNTEHTLAEHVAELERIAVTGSVTADNLKRQMRDTRGLLSLARIELRMPAFVPRWYRKTVDTISDYPRILRGTVKAMRMGVDVARPLVDAWHHFEHGFSTLILDSVEHAAAGLSAVAQKWETERSSGVDLAVAVLGMGRDLELAARRALAVRGLLGRAGVSLAQSVSALQQYGLPPNVPEAVKLFTYVRNRLAHGRTATDHHLHEALSSATTILDAITALPTEINVVYHPGVVVFTNPNCTNRIRDARGVILQTTSPNGVKTFRIFPTTHSHFKKGEQVAWEWNMARIWPAAWFPDPDTGQIKEAWGSSAEFIGRHLDDI
jgi:hypothetical protein